MIKVLYFLRRLFDGLASYFCLLSFAFWLAFTYPDCDLFAVLYACVLTFLWCFFLYCVVELAIRILRLKQRREKKMASDEKNLGSPS